MSSITVTEIVQEVEVVTAGVPGSTGPTGATGSTGEGVPVGGTTGQALLKTSATDYATEWGDGGGGAVDSVFTRTGAVVAAASDYDASQIDNDSGVVGAFVSDALDTLAAGAGATTISTLLAITGTQVKLVYISANTRWEYPDGTVPSLTGRAASITWEGTSAQIPAQGTADAEFQVGDTAFVRDVSL